MGNTKRLLILAAAMILSACGGGSNGSSGISYNDTPPPSSTPPAPPAATSAGYYTFADSSTGLSGEMIVAPNGTVYAVTSQPGCLMIYNGTITINGNDVSGSANYGPDILQNQSCGAGGTFTYNGSIIVGHEIDMTGDGQDIEWDYNSTVSQVNATLSAVDGNWTTSDGTVVSISGAQITAQDATDGCVVNGTATVSQNVYYVSLQYASCTGASAVFNGQTATGVYMLDVNDNKLFGDASITVGGATYIVAETLQKD